MPDLLTSDVLTGTNTKTVTNKTIDVGSTFGGNPAGNIIKGVGVDNPFTGARTGIYLGIGTQNGDGILNRGLTSVGTTDHEWNATEGVGYKYATSAVSGTAAGLRQDRQFFRRQWNGLLQIRLNASTTSNIRMFVGFHQTDNAAVVGEDPINALHGCGLGKRSADTNWQIMLNDGSGATTFVDSGVAFSTSAVTLEMEINDTPEFKSRIGSTNLTTQTAQLPSATQNLAFQVHCQNSDAVDKHIIIYRAFVRSNI